LILLKTTRRDNIWKININEALFDEEDSHEILRIPLVDSTQGIN